MKVAIDIGHARMTGSRGCGCEEHELCSRMAPILKRMLEEFCMEAVVVDFPDMSNAGDLAETVRAINACKADVSVSLHCDADDSPEPHGAHVIYRSAAGKKLGFEIAKWLCPLMPGRSETLVKRTGLYVLNKTACPAVLVELGFITNVDDCLMLRDEPEELMAAVAAGIVAYRDLFE